MTLSLDNTADGLSLAPSERIIQKEKAVNKFARVTQFITWPVLYVIFHACFDIRIHGEHNFSKVKAPFMIIANHVSYYDSFLFRLILGFKTSHLPLRFMAVNRFDWRFLNFLADAEIIDLIYALFGVFTVVPGRGLKANLEKPREIIKAGGNVVIYPEGKIFHGQGVGPFKKGAAVLMKQMGVAMIPVSFRLGGRNLIRRRLHINVGGPMNILHDRTVEEITLSFERDVRELFER